MFVRSFAWRAARYHARTLSLRQPDRFAGCSRFSIVGHVRAAYAPARSKDASTERYDRCMAQMTSADKLAVERRAAIERTRGMFAHLAPGKSLANDLIADRRAEARAEDQEAIEEARRLRGG